MNDDLQEKRMAGDYEVIRALYIGDREIVLGENVQEDTGPLKLYHQPTTPPDISYFPASNPIQTYAKHPP